MRYRSWTGHEEKDRDGFFRTIYRRGRALGPVNRVSSSAIRFALRVTGRRPDSFYLHLPRLGPVDSMLPNGRHLRLWSNMDDDGVANRVFWFGWDGWEREVTQTLFRLASGSQLMVDVGAHVGVESLVMALGNPGAKILAFEPHPATFQRLLTHIKRTGADNIEAFRIALAGRSGTAELVVAHSGIPSMSGLDSASMETLMGHGGMASISVRTDTLDDFLSARGVKGVDLIKIDTEGSEPDVIRGALTTIDEGRPIVLCEVLPFLQTGADLAALFSPRGYAFYLLTRTGPVRSDDISGRADATNYLLIPEERRGECAQLLNTELP